MNSVTQIEPIDLAARARAMLHELAELTLDLAREVQRQAIGQARAAEPADPTGREPQGGAGLLFTRVARTLRQIIALDSRMTDAQQARDTGSAAQRARHAAAERRRSRDARHQLRRRLAEAVQGDATGRDTDALLRDLEDRLHDDDIDAMLATTELTDIVVALCAEFGLKPDLSDLSDDDLARLADGPDETFLNPAPPTFLTPD